MDRKFVAAAFGYGAVGLILGIYMAASKNHSQHVAHAHIMLVGFVVSFVYGACHKLWLNNNESGFAKAQFYLHQLGAFVLSIGLYLLYGGIVPADTLEPVLIVGSLSVLLAMLMMKILFIRSKNST